MEALKRDPVCGMTVVEACAYEATKDRRLFYSEMCPRTFVGRPKAGGRG